jgi:SAM-dependent methyltransferase
MHGAEAPSPWVVRFAHLVAPGASVLDVACGAGRHTRWFSARGCTVDAVDRDAALADAFAADLEGGPWPYSTRHFDAVVVTNYLHRPLFPALARAVADGGVLIYETFARGNEAFGKPSNPAFLLHPGELLNVFSAGFSVVAYEDGVVELPKRARIQRLCASRGASGEIARLDDVAAGERR